MSTHEEPLISTPPATAARRGSPLGAALIAVAIVVGSILGASIIGGKMARTKGPDSPGKSVNTDGAHVVQMPGGYPNVATKCSGVPDSRVWVTNDGRQPVITNDPKC